MENRSLLFKTFPYFIKDKTWFSYTSPLNMTFKFYHILIFCHISFTVTFITRALVMKLQKHQTEVQILQLFVYLSIVIHFFYIYYCVCMHGRSVQDTAHVCNTQFSLTFQWVLRDQTQTLELVANIFTHSIIQAALHIVLYWRYGSITLFLVLHSDLFKFHLSSVAACPLEILIPAHLHSFGTRPFEMEKGSKALTKE